MSLKNTSSDKAKRPYQHLYDLHRWTRRSQQQLHDEPLCRMCFDKGLIIAAECADHIEPHRGDYQKFWFGELQSLCFRCHDSKKQSEEKLGYNRQIGNDGFPVDPKHPFYARQKS